MTVLAATRSGVSRLVGLDRLRGLAILLMVLDHVWMLAGGPVELRWTVTRAAMPLFFVVAGSLVRRLTWRHAWVAWVGLALPLAVPWIDRPNVLVWYAVGAVCVAVAGRSGPRGLWLALGVLLTVAANGYGAGVWAHSYEPAATVGLMLVGALAGRGSVAQLGDRLPGWLAWPGRYPLTAYVGHLLVLRVIFGA